jgi:prepilin-type N-terminal cleavage/methylation domain-containing protein
VRRTTVRGFTFIEVVVVIVIIGILSVVAFDSLRRTRPRATFEGAAAELQSLIHAARQEALASGRDVAVLVFPDYATSPTATGRILVVQDDTVTKQSILAEGADLNLGTYKAGLPASPPNGRLVATFDLPDGVLVGLGAGPGPGKLPFPYGTITTDVSCSFCADDGDHRGAIVFDSRGRSRFYSASGATISISGQAGGASLSLYGTALNNSSSTLVITSPQGMVRTIHNG